MSVYRNHCGRFEIEVSEPSPMWVRIVDGDDVIRLITTEDLHDLKYLIDRALIAAQARQPSGERK